MKNNNKSNSKPLVIGVLIIAVVATIITVYISHQNSVQTAFFARSINDASYDCEDKIDSRFDDSLVSKYYDEMSSGYEASKRHYRIYYRVSVRTTEDNRPAIKDYMARCIVWERLGYVSDFQLLDIL